MGFKDMMTSMRRAMMCCGERKKRTLEIGTATDVRRGVLYMPEEQQQAIREKATTDAAARLLSLTSHPPTRPSSNPSSMPPSLASSREPSDILLNSASANLPTSVPTPPRQTHSDNVPPSSAHSRMKGFWERTRRLSNAMSTHSHSGYHDLGKDDDEGVVMLNLDLKDLELESPVSRKSVVEGFEVQDVVAGHKEEPSPPVSKNSRVARAIQDLEGAESSSDEDTEGRPLVAQPVRV